MRNDEEMKWQVLNSELLFERPWLTVRRDKALLPTGRIHDEYYVLHYPAWVNVVAITEDGKMILERQYRHGIQRVGWEIPAGVVESEEEPLHAAQRELEEETGYGGGKWISFLSVAPNASSMDNVSYTFLAVGVHPVAQCHLDDTEDIEVVLMDLKQVRLMLERGEFLQALMVAPLWKFFCERNSFNI